MEIYWSPRSKRELKHIAEYLDYTFGKRVALAMVKETEVWTTRLSNNPELGSPEPLLSDKVIHYRSLIFTNHNKLIYYIKGNKIWISDIWDMRRHPEVLAKRIKSK